MKDRRRTFAIIVIVAIPVLIIAGFFVVRDWVIPTFSVPSVTGVPTVVDNKIDALRTSQAQTRVARQTAAPAAATATPTPAS